MNEEYYVYKNYNSGVYIGEVKKDTCIVGYDAITNKYVAALDNGTGISNVYTKEEVNTIVTELEEKIESNSTNINAITSIVNTNKNNIETLNTQVNTNTSDITEIKAQLGNMATTSNVEVVSSIANKNKTDIENLTTALNHQILTHIQVFSEEECDNLFDIYSSEFSDHTFYRFSVSIKISYIPFGTGGEFYVEGYKTSDSYEYQIVRIYAYARFTEDGIVEFVRSKHDNVWSDWHQRA